MKYSYMTLFDYLALLSWQNCPISSQDFDFLRDSGIENPEKFHIFLSFSKTREYVLSNKNWWKKAEQDYKSCQEKAYHILSPDKKDYPKSFLECYEKIPIFSVLGKIPKDFLPVTFVGSRQPDELVLNWMDFYLPDLLKEKKICIVSGGARGIDQKAHKIAIRSGKPTLCFLPSGLDSFYPKSLYPLKSSILDQGGAFISCFPYWEEMRKSYFHKRNALMSAYSKLVVILQAQIRSGSMLTAKKSLELGTPIAVVPGPILSASWTGNLQLIYDGADMIRDHLDLSILVDRLNPKVFQVESVETESVRKKESNETE